MEHHEQLQARALSNTLSAAPAVAAAHLATETAGWIERAAEAAAASGTAEPAAAAVIAHLAGVRRQQWLAGAARMTEAAHALRRAGHAAAHSTAGQDMELASQLNPV